MKSYMKKNAIILSLVMIIGTALLLVGCGEPDSPFIGKWNLSEIEYLGMTFSPEDLDMSKEDYVEFKSNGKVTLDVMDDKITVKWEAYEKDEKKGKIKDSETELDASINKDGDTLDLTYEEAGMVMRFKKAK